MTSPNIDNKCSLNKMTSTTKLTSKSLHIHPAGRTNRDCHPSCSIQKKHKITKKNKKNKEKKEKKY